MTPANITALVNATQKLTLLTIERQNAKKEYMENPCNSTCQLYEDYHNAVTNAKTNLEDAIINARCN